jgi:prefoldin subunit 5
MTQQLDKINAEIQLRVGELHQLRDSLKSLSNSKNIYQNIEQKLV